MSKENKRLKIEILDKPFSFLDKVIPIIKAIASSLIWGLGQLFNRQYRKAIFFFLIFTLVIGIEITSSNYFKGFDPYASKIEGNDYKDTLSKTIYNQYKKSFTNPLGYPDFDAFYQEHVTKTLTMEQLIDFIASDLLKNNPSKFFNLLESTKDPQTRTEILKSENDLTVNGQEIIIKETYYEKKDEVGSKYYKKTEFIQGKTVVTYENAAGKVLTAEELFGYKIVLLPTDKGNITCYLKNDKTYKKEIGGLFNPKVTFVNIDNDNDIVEEKDFYDCRELIKDKGIFTDSLYTKLYIEIFDNYAKTATYQNLLDKTEISSNSGLQKVTVSHRLFLYEGVIYEWFNPEVLEVGYLPTEFSSFVASEMERIYSAPGGSRYSKDDFTKFLIRIYFKMHPEVARDFETRFDNFYYDHAGFFIKGIWSIITLGQTDSATYYEHCLLTKALGFKVDGVEQWMESVTVKGHDSMNILIKGLISTLLLCYFLIIWIWSIKDAYQVGIQMKQVGCRVSDKGYFKVVYEKSFEYIVLFPAMFMVTFISIMPILFGFLIAFTNYKSNIVLVSWVGFDNFINIFSFGRVGDISIPFGSVFWSVFLWTVIWAIFSTLTVFFGGFLQALIINHERVPLKKFWRTLLILPWAVPAIVSQMVFSMIFKETGVINATLSSIGVYDLLKSWGMLGRPIFEFTTSFSRLFYLGQENIQWFTNPYNKWFVRTTLIVVNIWLGFPYYMALMSGVMVGIDKTLYEAAEIDGASKRQRFRYITFPLVLYSTAPILVMSFSGNFNNFGVIYFITEGGFGAGDLTRAYAGDTDILISWMYSLTVTHKIFNMASVFSILIFIVVGSVAAWNYSRTRAFKED